MILLNNAANRRLVNLMRDVVESETGFRVSIDKTWNCRKDIRFEIGAVETVFSFLVITDYDAHGHFDMHIRMLSEQIESDYLWILALRMNSVSKLQNRLTDMMNEAQPAPSYYAKEATA